MSTLDEIKKIIEEETQQESPEIRITGRETTFSEVVEAEEISCPEGHKTFSEVFGFHPMEVGIPDHPVRMGRGGADVPPETKFETYTPNREVLAQLSLCVSTGKNTSLVGPTGSGKTSIQEYYASLTERPYFRINGRGDMESEEILGRPWVNDGSMEYITSEFLKAWVSPRDYFITIDEWTAIPSHIMSSLQRGMEDNCREIQVEGLPEDVPSLYTASKGLTVCLSANVIGVGDGSDKYGANSMQDGSMVNRIGYIIDVPYMKEVEELTMLTTAYPEVDRKVLKNLVSLFTLLKQGYERDQLSTAVSPRTYQAVLDLYSMGVSIRQALNMAVGNKYPELEKEVFDEHCRSTGF